MISLPVVLATGRFVSANSGSVLRYNTAASSLKLLPIDVAFRAWPVAVVTLKNRTLNPVVKTFYQMCARSGCTIGSLRSRYFCYKKCSAARLYWLDEEEDPACAAVKREADEDWGMVRRGPRKP